MAWSPGGDAKRETCGSWSTAVPDGPLVVFSALEDAASERDDDDFSVVCAVVSMSRQESFGEGRELIDCPEGALSPSLTNVSNRGDNLLGSVGIDGFMEERVGTEKHPFVTGASNVGDDDIICSNEGIAGCSLH